MASKYVDIPSTMQVIACIYQNPSLLDNENYKISQDDMVEDFHKIVFGSIYNLYTLGAKKIDLATIVNYLEQRPKMHAIFKAHKGEDYLDQLLENAQPAAFDYYYRRMKKFTLLRMYDKVGVDCTFIYDPNNLFDQAKKQKQEEYLDNTSIQRIAELIDAKIERIKAKYVDNADEQVAKAGERSMALLSELQQNPDFGYPMYTKHLNTIWRGERLGKFYLRSAPTNCGKSRAMIADACYTACYEMYDTEKKEWVKIGTKEPTFYVPTEQSVDEVETMMWAFISGVPEDHILENHYEEGELERVIHAIEVIKNSPLYIKELHDFSLSDIENMVRFAVREYHIRYMCLDYIHSSLKILSEIGSGAKVQGLREDSVLFLLGVKLKDLANEFGIFIISSTQLNGNYTTSDTPDQNLLRGAKSLGDKVDGGAIMLNLTPEDKEALRPICDAQGLPLPNMKISIYKNRRGRYNHCYVWCFADLGTCRINSLFATEYDYTPIDMPVYNIKVKEEESAF